MGSAVRTRTLLARLGASVVVNDTGVALDGSQPDPVLADSVARSLRDDGRNGASPTTRDVSSFAGAASAVQHAVDEFGRIDILINNAGTLHSGSVPRRRRSRSARRPAGARGRHRRDDARRVPFMRAQRWGRIVNTLSEAALHTDLAAGIAYSTAKAAVWGATMSGALDGRRARHHRQRAVAGCADPDVRDRSSRLRASPPGSTFRRSGWPRSSSGCAREAAHDITGRVVHTAGGHVREFVMQRVDDTDLVRRLRAHRAALR